MSSDAAVSAALRSNGSIVAVEAPAGCGKTHQGASYAAAVSSTLGNGRVLVLTHTNAAADVFSSRTDAARVDVRTIDSLLVQVARPYHKSLGLPLDVASWAADDPKRFPQLGAMVARFLTTTPMVSSTLASRYPVVICDEHQDADEFQHNVIMAIARAGALIRVFADPMQRIYSSKTSASADITRWQHLRDNAHAAPSLDVPHRWISAPRLGDWILKARRALAGGGTVDIRHAPPEVSVIVADNAASSRFGAFATDPGPAKLIRNYVDRSSSILVLTHFNTHVEALNAYFYRRYPIWEGHTRDNLSALMRGLEKNEGNIVDLVNAFNTFLYRVTKGYTASGFGSLLVSEIKDGCTRSRRGKPGKLQELGRIILATPNYRGVAQALQRLQILIKTEPTFSDIRIDMRREFREATLLDRFDDVTIARSELARYRALHTGQPQAKALSTIHKAKGLECDAVIVLPCDADTFKDTDSDRCLLYVAMSRASKQLTLVVSQQNPSPLLSI